MKHLKLELDEKTYHHLKTKFKGDNEAMSDFAIKALTDALVKTFNGKSKAGSDKNTPDVKDYLKSDKSGSRSYGIKGQGW